MVVTPEVISYVPARDVQLQNVPLVFVTPLGRAGAVTRELQLINAFSILVTVLGVSGASVSNGIFVKVASRLVIGSPQILFKN